jgi:hypothetical protein
MENSENDNRIGPNDIKDAVWESPRQHSAHLRILSYKQIGQRVLPSTFYSSLNLGGNLITPDPPHGFHTKARPLAGPLQLLTEQSAFGSLGEAAPNARFDFSP